MIQLRRHHLRHAILLVLHDTERAMTVAEIVALLAVDGIAPARAPASRAISDAMRTDVAAGRIVRLGWGCYAARRVSAGHLRYARRSVRDAVRLEREGAA